MSEPNAFHLNTVLDAIAAWVASLPPDEQAALLGDGFSVKGDVLFGAQIERESISSESTVAQMSEESKFSVISDQYSVIS